MTTRLLLTFFTASLTLNVLGSSQASQVCDPQVNAKKFTLTKNLLYLIYNGRPQYLDFYKPVNVSNPPLIMFIHGGSWYEYTKDQTKFVDIAQKLSMLGFAIASLDYPLYYRDQTSTIINGFPVGISAVRCGARYLVANASSLGFDPTRISVMGTSAGGNLAGLLAYAGNQNQVLDSVSCGSAATPLPQAKTAILYYPPVDLTDSVVPADVPNAQNPYGSGNLALRDTFWVMDYLYDRVSDYGAGASILPYLATSAVGSQFDSRLETLIVHGDADQYVDIRQSQLLSERLAELSLSKTFVVEKGQPHGFKPFGVPSSCDLKAFLLRFAK